MAVDRMGALIQCVQKEEVPYYPKPSVELVLGSDREIGRTTFSQEKRVAFTPEQCRELREFCRAIGLYLHVYVVEGAGERAGYANTHYIENGAEIVTKGELKYLDNAPDVFVGLKEPSEYEGDVPRPFVRIGAFHPHAFHEESGTARLLAQPSNSTVGVNWPALICGSGLGDLRRRSPIKGSMSVFAGRVAAEWIMSDLKGAGLSGHVVVVGAGYAGRAAVDELSSCELVTRISLFDDASNPDRVAKVRESYESRNDVTVRGIRGTDDPELTDALGGSVGVALAVFRPGEETPKVVSVDALNALPQESATVVDISIDEGGAIHDSTIVDAGSTWPPERLIRHFKGRLPGLQYRALPNMPRAYPREASRVHGAMILPYLGALLFVAGREGGSRGLIEHLRSLPVRAGNADPAHVAESEVLNALTQDLRNGLAFYPEASTSQSSEAHELEQRLVLGHLLVGQKKFTNFLDANSIPFQQNAT